MPFNFQTGSFAAVLIYLGVIAAELIFSYQDTTIGEKRDKEQAAKEKQNKGLSPDKR